MLTPSEREVLMFCRDQPRSPYSMPETEQRVARALADRDMLILQEGADGEYRYTLMLAGLDALALAEAPDFPAGHDPVFAALVHVSALAGSHGKHDLERKLAELIEAY